MHLWLVLVAMFGCSLAAPQNWPYPDSLMPYRYGYPGQAGQYKYLPELEDDEDVGPYLSTHHKSGRQDLVVGEGQSLRSQYRNAAWRYGDAPGAQPARPTELPGVSVVETGSVAPVTAGDEAGKVHAEPAPPPKVTSSVAPKPVVDGKPVQPPAFPPARPPPTDPPKEKEEDEEDDDDSDEDDADADDEHEHPPSDDQDDETDDDEEEDADDDPEDDDDDDDERRRQEPLKEAAAVPSSVAPAVVAPPAPVVSNSSEVVPASVAQVVPSKDVVKSVVPAQVVDPDDETSSEEVGSPPVEALVPGYITEQGEVLVPVDTVIGDQPISIVDDPSSPPARGVPFHGASYDPMTSPYYFPNIYRRHDSSRQADDESDEVELDDEDENDDDDDDDDDIVHTPADVSAEGRNEFLTSFPPSRTPELYALIQSRIPVDSNVEYEDYQVYGNRPYASNQKNKVSYNGQQRPVYSGPFVQQQQQRRPDYNPHAGQRPVFNPYNVVRRPVYDGPYSQQSAYNGRPGQQGMSMAVAISGNGVPYVVRTPYAPFVRNNMGYNVNRYQGPYSPNYRPVQNNQYSMYRRPVYQPNPFNGYVSPQYNPFRQGGYSPRPPVPGAPDEFGGSNNYRPQINNRIVIHGNPAQNFGPRPIPVYSGDRPQAVQIGYRRPVQKPGQVVKVTKPKVKNSNKRKPTPVVHQDDEYVYESAVPQDVVLDSSSLPDSYEQEQTSRKVIPQVVASKKKARRNPKMAKKPKANKKNKKSKKTTTNSDPLNIFKKTNTKSRRN